METKSPCQPYPIINLVWDEQWALAKWESTCRSLCNSGPVITIDFEAFIDPTHGSWWLLFIPTKIQDVLSNSKKFVPLGSNSMLCVFHFSSSLHPAKLSVWGTLISGPTQHGTKSDVLMELKDSFLFLFPRAQLYIKIPREEAKARQGSSALALLNSALQKWHAGICEMTAPAHSLHCLADEEVIAASLISLHSACGRRHKEWIDVYTNHCCERWPYHQI